MKTVSLYRPLNLGQTMVDIDRFMESFFGESPFNRESGAFARLPAVDIEETNDAYLLEAELPGYTESDIEVNVDGGTLTIASKKGEISADKKKEVERHYIMKERGIAAFSRSFRLPENADAEAISASFKNGLLCMEIKKRTEAQKRIIAIDKKD
jgi:HSP20 family protein